MLSLSIFFKKYFFFYFNTLITIFITRNSLHKLLEIHYTQIHVQLNILFLKEWQKLKLKSTFTLKQIKKCGLIDRFISVEIFNMRQNRKGDVQIMNQSNKYAFFMNNNYYLLKEIR